MWYILSQDTYLSVIDQPCEASRCPFKSVDKEVICISCADRFIKVIRLIGEQVRPDFSFPAAANIDVGCDCFSKHPEGISGFRVSEPDLCAENAIFLPEAIA